MNAFLALYVAATATLAAVIVVDDTASQRLGRWLIALAYAKRAWMAEYRRCYAAWEEKHG